MAVKSGKKRARTKPDTTKRSGGPFAPKGSITTRTQSNTNLVKPGKKGAYGGQGILLPSPTGAGVANKRRNKSTTPAGASGGSGGGSGGTTTPPNKPKPPRKPKAPMTGNPGNTKPKGKAGEKEDKGMWPGGGQRGKGDNKDKKKKK